MLAPALLLCSVLLVSALSIPSSALHTHASVTGNSSLLWGPYRPNLYFGIRARTPESPLMGLMWARGHGSSLAEKNLRHTCEQSDNMDGYGWTAYDPRHGGSQVVHDVGNGLNVTTEFFRPPGPQHQHSWGARIKAQPRANADKAVKSTAIFYISLEDMHSNPSTSLQCRSVDNAVRCDGRTASLGGFQLRVQRARSTSSNYQPIVTVHSVSVPDETLWQAKCKWPVA